MLFRRNEPFRYSFENPLSCSLKTVGHMDRGYVLDLSPKGMKVESNTRLYVGDKISITLTICNMEMKLDGTLKWERDFNNRWIYGILLDDNETMKNTIISELKIYAKSVRMNKTYKTI